MVINPKHRNWTKDELEFLTRNCEQLTLKQASRLLNRSPGALHHLVRVRGLKFINPRWTQWSPEEEAKLRVLAPEHTKEEIAKELGRTIPSVKDRALKLGIEMKQRVRWWSDRELRYLEWNAENKSFEEIAQALGRTRSSVYYKAVELNIKERAAYSGLNEVIRRTGYCSTQLLRARRELKQAWRSVKRGRLRQYLISEEQVEALIAHLTRKVYPLSMLSMLTGYTPSILRQAGKELRQTWTTVPGTEIYEISDEQREELVAYLEKRSTYLRLEEIARRLEVSAVTVTRARDRLGQTWITQGGRLYFITREQAAELEQHILSRPKVLQKLELQKRAKAA